MAKTLTKQDLKQPDEFITIGMRFVEWAQKNVVLVVVIIVAPLLGAGYYFSMNQTKHDREVEAASRLYAGEKKLDTASSFGGFRMPGLNPAKPEDQKAALAVFQQVAKDYPGTKAERRAHLLAGDVASDLADYDTAIAEYGAVTDGTPLERSYALEGRAAALEAKKSYDDAASSLHKIIDDKDLANRDIASLDLVRVLVEAGKKDDARALLARFPTDFPNSSLKSQAESRLTELGGAPAEAAAPATSPAIN